MFEGPWIPALGFGFANKSTMILVVANHDLENSHRHWIRLENLPNRFQMAIDSAKVILSSENENNQADLNLEIGDRALCAAFLPGEVKSSKLLIEIVNFSFILNFNNLSIKK